MMRTLIVMAALAMAACAATATPSASAEPMKEIARGFHSQQTERLFELVTDAARFDALWRLHGSSGRPSIDFNEHAVLALFVGDKPTGGHAVIVEGVTRNGATLEVDVAVYEPGPGCMTTQAFTQPYQFVQVKAGATDANFNVRRVAEPCE